TPVKNRDLWQRLDRLLEIHDVEGRAGRLEKADDLAAPRYAAVKRGRRIRIDPAAKHEAQSTKPDAISKHQLRNVQDQLGFGQSIFGRSNSFRISDFVLRIFKRTTQPPRREPHLATT